MTVALAVFYFYSENVRRVQLHVIESAGIFEDTRNVPCLKSKLNHQLHFGYFLALRV